MFSRSASTLLKASSSASSSSSIIVPLSVRSYTNIRDAGGAFARRRLRRRRSLRMTMTRRLVERFSVFCFFYENGGGGLWVVERGSKKGRGWRFVMGRLLLVGSPLMTFFQWIWRGSYKKKYAAMGIVARRLREYIKTLIKKLKEEIAKRPAAPAAPAPAAAEAEPAKPSDPAQARMSPMDSSYGGAVRGGGGALGKKEAAIEEKFFRDLEKEKLEKLKKKK
ncbi:hypothetical protein BC829DRAFT_436472 [Chytridium lagenaria]|nr:hypothetical protein BC829DRAFT_436472 [Chytridium lagenaria]